MELVLYQTSK